MDEEETNGGGPPLIPMDIEEEEIDSLIRETIEEDRFIPPSGRKRFNLVVSRRPNKHSDGGGMSAKSTTARILGLLRSNIGNASILRAFGFVAGLGFFTLLLANFWEHDMEKIPIEHSDSKSHHGPSLGGSKNPGHYEYNGPYHDDSLDAIDDDGYLKNFEVTKAKYDDDEILDSLILPKSNVGSSVISRSNANIKNLPGHFLHDPLKSPYASPLYMANANNATRQALLQKDFEIRMNRTIALYGKWETPELPEGTKTHLEGSILQTSHKDYESFPADSWQSNADYLKAFLKQASALVERVKEGIYEEYGYGIVNNITSSKDRDSRIADRILEFQVIVDDKLILTEDTYMAVDDEAKKRIPGIAYLNTAAWEGLVRKLLHGMMTHDDFYVVSAGQLETYVSNNFFQSAVMQFNYIMEPVFDKLGMRLISRNMGMDASTTISALGGADIYGEADIFLYLGQPEEVGMMDFLHRQSILSGARVPVLLSPMIGSLHDATGSSAWVGNLQPGAPFCEATFVEQGTNRLMVPLVPACRYVVCDDTIKDRCDKHNSVCWVDRANQNQEMAEQHVDVGRKDEFFPNYNEQRLEGRKIAMMVLEALGEAISRWSAAVKRGNVPLSITAWHVGQAYDEVRKSVREAKHTACETFMRKLDPRICHIEMHAFTEWTPRVHPNVVRLKNMLERTQLADNHQLMKEIYTGVDLLPIKWMPDSKEVDVHMIAIAADTEHMKQESELYADTALDMGTLSDDDHMFIKDDDNWMNDDYNDLTVRYRRKLFTDDFSTDDRWTLYNAPKGFCDGSAQSRCNRVSTNTCLLSGYNFYKSGIMGHGHSGKLVFSIPSVKEGIILARFEWRMDDGPRVRGLPHDVKIVFTVNGKTIYHTRQTFAASVVALADDLFLHPLLIEKDMNDDKPTRKVEVEIEAISAIQGDRRLIMLSHIYYA